MEFKLCTDLAMQRQDNNRKVKLLVYLIGEQGKEIFYILKLTITSSFKAVLEPWGSIAPKAEQNRGERDFSLEINLNRQKRTPVLQPYTHSLHFSRT